jgi:hypothetical protein
MLQSLNYGFLGLDRILQLQGPLLNHDLTDQQPDTATAKPFGGTTTTPKLQWQLQFPQKVFAVA